MSARLTSAIVLLTLALALVVAACGGGSSNGPEQSRPPKPTEAAPTEAAPTEPAPTEEGMAPVDEEQAATESGEPAAENDQPSGRDEQASEQSETESAPPIEQPIGEGPDLRVSGLAVYTKGVDVWVQRGMDAALLIQGSERIVLFTPAIAPDGVRVAYVRFDQAPGNISEIGSDLHLIDLGSEIDIPVREHGRQGEFFWTPAWFPDGSGLLYSHQVNEASEGGGLFSVDIEILALDSGVVTLLREDATDPAVSPDGSLLAFVDQPATDHVLAVMDFPSGEPRRLLDTTNNLAFFRFPRFSPDGQWIAFLASGDGPLAAAASPDRTLTPPAATLSNGVQDVWLIRPDGTGLTRLTTVLEDTPDYSWSTDGRHILLRGAFGVYLVEVATRTTQTLGPGEFHGTHDWAGSVEDGPS